VLCDLANGNADGVTSEMVAKACAAGDPAAEEVIRETLDLLAYWLGSIIDPLEPEVIVMGGGVSTMLAPLLNKIRERWRGACLNPARWKFHWYSLAMAKTPESLALRHSVNSSDMCNFYDVSFESEMTFERTVLSLAPVLRHSPAPAGRRTSYSGCTGFTLGFSSATEIARTRILVLSGSLMVFVPGSKSMA
jgi:hypothetical protein